MDQQQERILADLRGALEGEIHCEDAFLQLYASDASIYELRPAAVVRPRSVADVSRCVQYAAENKLPIHARGAGTGLAGESLGSGIVIDFSHSMRRILEIGEDFARVQPGVVLADLNRQLATQQRMFGPDPATRSVTTLGSVLALDGAGSHWPRYGSARRHVRRLQLVLADGEVVEVSRHQLGEAGESPNRESPRRDELVERLGALIQREQETIRKNWPRSPVNRSGYAVHDTLQGNTLDLARLVVGSEGTLALITEATVETVPQPAHRGLALLFSERLEQAARAALEAGRLAPAACDLLDRRLLSIARETDPWFERIIPRDAEAALLVEVQADTHAGVTDQLQQVVYRLERRRRLVFHSSTTQQRDERDQIWRLARRVVPRLYRLRGNTRPLPFIEDIAVPPETLPDFLVTLQNVFKAHQVTATMFAHATQGQLHVRPFLDLADPEHVGKMQDLAADVYERVLAVGGTVSGEHGDGLSRTWFLKRQFGPVYDVFREVKRIFDPANILNPGKVVADAPQPLTKNLRPVAALAAEKPALPLILNWEDDEAGHATRLCNGCGRCRTQGPDERMCPMFRFAPREEASPRAKANLMRGLLTGSLAIGEAGAEPLRELADLCVNCHQCRDECPAGVDIPKLVLEVKAQLVLAHGLTTSQWVVTRLERLSALGSRFASVANWALGNRQMRWLLERLLGIAQGRKLPPFATRTFLRHAQRRRLQRMIRGGGAKVLYFSDVYANWHDPQLGVALVEILQHNGVSVYVPPRPLVSRMQAITLGETERSKRDAARNVKLLADAIRHGYEVVTTEPAAGACLRHEYTQLLGDDDSRLVAEHTQDACDYLWRRHETGELKLDFRPLPISIGYHLPCHLRSLGGNSPGERLLRLIPGLNVRRVTESCSGMAGAFGLMRENYRNSLRAGWPLILAMRDPGLQLGATECSACKLQMEQGTTKPTLHPLLILALSYGLLPDVESRLHARGHELVTT